MRIVNLRQLVQEPDGTVFCGWQPCIVEGLMVKTGSCTDYDFFYQSLMPDVYPLTHAESAAAFDAATPTAVCDAVSRWGLYDDDDQFVVYETHELKQLGEWILKLASGNTE